MELIWGIELLSLHGGALVLGTLMVIAYFYAPANKLPVINSVPKKWKAILGVGLIAFAAMSAGAISFDAQDAQPAQQVDYYSTSDIEVYTYDQKTGEVISGDTHWYEPGVSTEEYVTEGSTILRTVTTTSGTATMNGWDTEKYPEAVSVIDVSGYYQDVETHDLRVERDIDSNTKGVTLRAVDIGTVDETKTDTSPSISAGSSADYTIFYGNSESDSSIYNGAVKVNNMVNVTIDVNSGAEKVTVDDTTYLVLDDSDVEGAEYATLSVEVSVDSGASEASFDLAYDDLFAQYGADAFPTDSDIQSASSASQSVSITV